MNECVAESRKHSPTDILQTETVAKQLKPRSGELPNRAVSVFYQNICDRQLSRAADEAAREFMSLTHVKVVVVMMAYMPFLEYQLLWSLYMSSNLILRITERQVLPYLFSIWESQREVEWPYQGHITLEIGLNPGLLCFQSSHFPLTALFLCHALESSVPGAGSEKNLLNLMIPFSALWQTANTMKEMPIRMLQKTH